MAARPGMYNLYLGGAHEGTRLNKLHRRDVGHDAIIAALAPLLGEYARGREANERFGDYVIRAGHVRATTAGNRISFRRATQIGELTMLSTGSALLAWPSLRQARGRMLGLPFVIATCSPAGMFGWRVCFAAAVLAVLANFIAFVPMTVLTLNGGQAMRSDLDVPPLTPRAYFGLLLLWTVTTWVAAAALNR